MTSRFNTIIAFQILLGVLLPLIISGCIVKPLDGDHLPSRSTPFIMEGYATVPGTEIEALAYAYKNNEWNSLRRTFALMSEGPNDLYHWTMRDLSLTLGYWRPVDFTDGIITWQALIKGQQGTFDLPTFTEIGYDCLLSQIIDYTPPFTAGQLCHTGTDITLTTTTAATEYPDIDWFRDFNHAIITAKSEDKLVFQFDAPAGSLKGNRMRADVFPQADIKAIIFEHYVAVVGYRDYCPTDPVWASNPKMCIWNPEDWDHWHPFDNEPLMAFGDELNHWHLRENLEHHIP